jgi:hypothetical protein
MLIAVDGAVETGELRMACQSASKTLEKTPSVKCEEESTHSTVNPPVMALKPTCQCTLYTKFLGVPIGVERELRRYNASSQVYSSESSRNSMWNVEVEYYRITRQFCRLESGSMLVRLANGILRITPDAWKRMKQKYNTKI